MSLYKRKSPVVAVQFKENEYLKNKLYYIDVFDKAMHSELWFDKTAKDGRYYIVNQGNTLDGNIYITVNDGDYIIREEDFTYVLPKEDFERNYDKAGD